MNEKEILLNLSRLQGIAQSGKTYGKDIYDQERYQELTEVTESLIRQLTVLDNSQISVFMTADEGYATPKVDIRAVVFNEQDRLLLVKEKSEEKWALPGGWGDIGYSPFEVAEKETREEAGINVTAQQLMAVRDMSKHDYPYRLTYVYKFFIYCRSEGGVPLPGIETADARFFNFDEIKETDLSLARNSLKDIRMAFDYHDTPFSTICD